MMKLSHEQEYPRMTQSRVVIRFQDCDPLQHLNNAKYFDYYYNARDDQVAKLYDFRMSELFEEFQSIWVVYNHQIAYLKSAMMGTWVGIFSRIIWFNNNSIVVEYFMTDENKTHLKNIMWTTLRYVKFGGGSTNHPDVLMDFLQKVTVPDIDYSPAGFQARIKAVKSEVIRWSE
ncbi:MAG: acyl-CoA thioesterase [Bacteroidota bacterium]